MSKPKFSILICSMFSRAESLSRLMAEIETQKPVGDLIEVLTSVDEGGVITTGTKRNLLLTQATGDYIAFVDDDDMILPGYVQLILSAIDVSPDVIGFRGYITTNGDQRRDWIISKDLGYEETTNEYGKIIYHRYNNHLSPVKTEIARQIGFPDKFVGEDYEYATNLKNSGLIKTESFIDEFLYHYDYKNKTVVQSINTQIQPQKKKIYVQPKQGRRFR